MDNMKNFILIIGKQTYQFDNLSSIYDSIIGKNDGTYSFLDKSKQDAMRYEMAFKNANCNPNFIGYLKDIPESEISSSKKIFIDNNKTYLLSILKSGIALLLAKKGTDLVKQLEPLKNNEDNYIIVNHFADKLLKETRNELLTNTNENKTLFSETIRPDFGK